MNARARSYIRATNRRTGQCCAASLGDIQDEKKGGFALKRGGTHACIWTRGHAIEVCTRCGAERPLVPGTELNAR